MLSSWHRFYYLAPSRLPLRLTLPVPAITLTAR